MDQQTHRCDACSRLYIGTECYLSDPSCSLHQLKELDALVKKSERADEQETMGGEEKEEGESTDVPDKGFCVRNEKGVVRLHGDEQGV